MTCGLTPQKLALTLCFGTALGIMPLLWGTSLICILLAHVFRLNHVALQSVNYLLYPVQLALLAPFFKLGAWLFPWGPPLPPHMLATLIRNPDLTSLHILAWITLKSLAAWLVIVLPAALLAYGILRTAAPGKNVRTSGPCKLHDQVT
jgi:uncharacterized protein (DUF2062 family)